MAGKPTFTQEVTNLMYAAEGSPVTACMQCGTCSGSCPAAGFMEHSPREIIAMIHAGLRDKVLESNTFWSCASCYYCTVKCPRGIDIAELMYGLKRYSIWRNRYKRGLIGPKFSRSFIRMIVRGGRIWEPGLATSYIFRRGPLGMVEEGITAMRLFAKGRIPVFPPRIRGAKGLRKILGRIVPVGGLR